MRFTVSAILASSLLWLMGACSESDYTDKYPDPSKTTTVTCEKLMTGVFMRGNSYTFKGYYGVFGWESYAVSRYSQVLGFTNSDGRYQIGETYFSDRWNNFYNLLPQFRLLEKTYEELPETSKSNYRIFLLLAKIYMLDHLSQICDAWGDVPFSKAGYLPINGDPATDRPSYDSAENLYEMIIDELGSINTEIAGMSSISSLTSAYLSAQDYFNKGDLTKWRKYCNSLRLRIALRVSLQGSLTSKGQAVVKEILSNTSQHPLVDNNNEITKGTPDEDGFSGFAGDPQSAYETWQGQFNRASDAMVKAMKDDPRIDVYFDVNADGVYQGVDMTTPYAEQTVLFDKGTYYSSFDSATFSRNRKLPGVTVSAAEVSFAKAEAYQRGFASGDAKTAFVEGIKQSCDFYFQVNSLSTYRTALTKPDDAAITDFAEARWNDATDKLEAIGTQKWINYGVLQPAQAWAEIRRTGYPALHFPTDGAAQLIQNVPNRFRYPASERDNNTENYQAVSGKDNWTDKMFWAK